MIKGLQNNKSTSSHEAVNLDPSIYEI